MSQTGAWEELLAHINGQLTNRGYLVKKKAMIDASVTPTPRKSHGKNTYMLPMHPDTLPTKEVKPSVDQEAVWVKKCSMAISTIIEPRAQMAWF